MAEPTSNRKITIEVSDTVYHLLEVLTKGEYAPKTVEDVVATLIDHAQQGVYRPGAWEREWLQSVFQGWEEHLEAGDPYGGSDGSMFRRPRTNLAAKARK